MQSYSQRTINRNIVEIFSKGGKGDGSIEHPGSGHTRNMFEKLKGLVKLKQKIEASLSESKKELMDTINSPLHYTVKNLHSKHVLTGRIKKLEKQIENLDKEISQWEEKMQSVDEKAILKEEQNNYQETQERIADEKGWTVRDGEYYDAEGNQVDESGNIIWSYKDIKKNEGSSS